MEDDQKDAEIQPGNDAVSQEEKGLPQTKAEQLFYQFCYPDTWFWEYGEWKQAALDILSSGIFKGNELRGGHNKTYHIDMGDLIINLVMKHFDFDVNLSSGRVYHRLEGLIEQEIVNEFNDHFCFVAAIARLGGIRKDHIQNIWDNWRKQVSAQAAKGNISPHWRRLIMDEMFPGHGYTPKTTPQQIGRKFADIFLQYIPQAPTARMVEWVNATLISLKRPIASKSSLNDYIKERQTSPVTPVTITE